MVGAMMNAIDVKVRIIIREQLPMLKQSEPK